MAKNLLDSKFFDSRITSPNVTAKEKWIGFLIGPTGALLVNAILGGGFLNIFYTDVIGIGNLWKGMFLAIFPVIAKILDAITNFIMGWIIERTHTKQGKARPYILLAAILLPISGILLYTVPNADQKIQAAWIMITYNLFFSIAYTIYNMSHSLMVPLSTRNTPLPALESAVPGGALWRYSTRWPPLWSRVSLRRCSFPCCCCP